jgi:PleD family two-component response regulator
MRLRWSIIDLRRDQSVVEQMHHLVLTDPLIGEAVERRRDIGARFGGDTLAILGEIGEHREQHEAADEIERLVERQAVEPEIDITADTAMTVDRG